MKDDQLAQKIKTLRKAKGLSQEALAEKAGLSLRTVQRIEIENKNPSGETLKRLSAALEVSPDDLMNWEPNENSNYLILLAISPILFVFNSFLAIIVPLILWLLKKNSIKGVKSLGIKILKIETIWLVVYFIFRTLNFLRLNYKMGEVISLNDSQMESMISGFNSQIYLKLFFIIVNVIIILILTYMTFKSNKAGYPNLNVKHLEAKLIVVFVLIVFAVSCSKHKQQEAQKTIDPCEYKISGFQAKNQSFNDSIFQYLNDGNMITVSKSDFEITDNLGQFLFGGNNFNYEIIDDSLCLESNGTRNSYKITHLDLNAFEIEIDNKYLEKIYFLKPKDKREEIVTKLEF